MARKKVEEVKEVPQKKEVIAPLSTESLGREDLNLLRDKINELIEAHNCDCN